MTRYGTKKIVRIIYFTVIVVIVLGYGVFASHDFILGPTITISEPANGTSFDHPDIKIKGVVRRIQDITLNSRSITIDEKGNFSETVLLAPGYNIFELRARDRFGRTTDDRLELVYKVN